VDENFSIALEAFQRKVARALYEPLTSSL